MARPNRFIQPGVPLHLVHRGHNRAATFGDDVDRWHFLEIVREASQRAALMIHAYVLMSNHVHFLATASDERGPASVFRHIGRRYVRFFNRRYGRSGSLWEGRYYSSHVDSARYFFTCSRYIELNPVRAELAPHPSSFRWSSYRCNAEGASDALLTPHPLYVALGETEASRQHAYRALFATQVDSLTVARIRQATRTRGSLGMASLGQPPVDIEAHLRAGGRTEAPRLVDWDSPRWERARTF